MIHGHNGPRGAIDARRDGQAHRNRRMFRPCRGIPGKQILPGGLAAQANIQQLWRTDVRRRRVMGHGR